MTLVDPFLSFRFVVDIGDEDPLDNVIAAGFSEVSGLETEVETEEYQEGGVNTHTHTFPGRVGYPNLVLRRGLGNSSMLYRWTAASTNGEFERRDLRVFLLDTLGAPRWGWAVEGAYPVKWTGPEMQADGSTVAMESLELAHRGIRKISQLPPELV